MRMCVNVSMCVFVFLCVFVRVFCVYVFVGLRLTGESSKADSDTAQTDTISPLASLRKTSGPMQRCRSKSTVEGRKSEESSLTMRLLAVHVMYLFILIRIEWGKRFKEK